MLNWLSGVPALLELLILVLTAAGLVWGAWRGIYGPAKRHFNRVNAGMDTLLGYPAVNDPGSGREIQPATPPLAARVYDLEDTNKRMVEALSVLADNQQRLMRLESSWEERERLGEQIITEWVEWRTAHEEEARAREARITEWEQWRVRQTRTVSEMKDKEIE
jgi:hypothetical protein